MRWAHIAWWGLVRSRLGRKHLEVHQGVVLGPRGVLLTVRAELYGWELPGGGAMRGETSAEAERLVASIVDYVDAASNATT